MVLEHSARRFIAFVLGLVFVGPMLAGNITIGLSDKQKEFATNDWGAIAYHAQISIALKRSGRTFKTNQIVELLVRLRNLSTNEDYGVYVASPLSGTEGFSFMITSPSGRDVSPTFRPSYRGSGGMVGVHPNQTDGFGFELGEICQTDEVGTYSILLKMKRWTPDRRKSFELVSNPLKVEIVAGK